MPFLAGAGFPGWRQYQRGSNFLNGFPRWGLGRIGGGSGERWAGSFLVVLGELLSCAWDETVSPLEVVRAGFDFCDHLDLCCWCWGWGCSLVSHTEVSRSRSEGGWLLGNYGHIRVTKGNCSCVQTRVWQGHCHSSG